MTDRPVFPESLPVRPNYPASTARPTVAANADANGTIKIVLAVLIFGVLGNLGLMLWLNRTHENALIVEAAAKDAHLIDEMVHVRSELAQAKAMAAQSTLEIGKLKMQYATMAGLVAGGSSSRGSFNTPMIPGRNSTPRVPDNAEQIESKPK